MSVLVPMFLNQQFRTLPSSGEDIHYSWQDKEENTHRITIPLEAPSAESRQEESVCRFRDPSLGPYREDSYPGHKYVRDKRFEDLTFRREQAQRKLNDEVRDGFEAYWILYFCEAEIQECVARDNRKVLEARQKAREIWEKSLNGRIWKLTKVAFSLIPTFPKDKKNLFCICGTILGGTLATAFFLEPRSSGLRLL